MKRRQTLALAGAGVLAVVAGGIVGWQQLATDANADKSVRVLYGQRLPALDGQEQDLGQWRGQRLVLNFWATWCAPCVDEMPELDALQAELRGKAQFVGIGIDTATNMQRFAQKIPVGYPLLVAGNVGTGLARELGNESGGLPFTVVIDEEGRVIHRYAGRIKADELRKVILQG